MTELNLHDYLDCPDKLQTACGWTVVAIYHNPKETGTRYEYLLILNNDGLLLNSHCCKKGVYQNRDDEQHPRNIVLKKPSLYYGQYKLFLETEFDSGDKIDKVIDLSSEYTEQEWTALTQQQQITYLDNKVTAFVEDNINYGWDYIK